MSTLSEIVRELRRTRAVSENGLACLDSIAESDVSQLMKRFIKNHKSIESQSPSKKRGFKCRRRKKVNTISRENLVNLQEEEGLRAGNKLRRAHIDFHKMKMKVALAAQTLSSSTANSIEYCDKYLGLRNFHGSSATVRFIICIDRIFDFLNSRNPLGKGFKAPLRRSNEVFWRESILKEINYLKVITDVAGVSIFRTRRYVPFVGFITAVLSVINIFDLYVKPETSQLKYLLTYKLSQDHLELFFCAIRQCGG